VYKKDAFRLDVMKEIFEIRSCIEILQNDIKVNTTEWHEGFMSCQIISAAANRDTTHF